MGAAKYKRIILKLSGESLAGDQGFGINPTVVEAIAKQIKKVHEEGVDVAIVVGGGNIWRGLSGSAKGMDRAQADYMGMLATCMNALAMQDGLQQVGVPSRVQTAIEMRQVAEPYIRGKAIRHMEKGRVVIFGAGTGNPYFTTDTTATLRAMEIEAQAVLMATNDVEGVFTADQHVDPNATLISEITYEEMLAKNLKVMDLTAVSLCMQGDIDIRVFNMKNPDNFLRVINGESIGTRISKGDK